MDILLLARELKEVADLVITDEAGHSVLLVKVQPEVGDEFQELVQLREHQRRFDFPFAMLANPERILLLGSSDLPDLAEPRVDLTTLETIRAYRSPYGDQSLRSKNDLLLPLGRWLHASTCEFLTDQHEGYCCFKKAGLAERIVWGHVLTREMLFREPGEVEPSY